MCCSACCSVCGSVCCSVLQVSKRRRQALQQCDLTHGKYEWVMAHTNESYKWVVSYMNESCHDSLICGITHSYMTWIWYACHDSFICMTRLIYTFDITHSYVCHGTLTCDTNTNAYTNKSWHTNECLVSHVCLCMCVFVCVCVFVCICVWSMSDSYVWHYSFICVTLLIHMCDMTHSHVRHDSSTPMFLRHANESYRKYECLMSHVQTSYVSYMDESCYTCE